MGVMDPLTPKSLGAAEESALRQARWGGWLKRGARWVAVAIVAFLVISIVVGYIRSHATQIGHSLGVGSAGWEEGYTYGQKAVGSSTLNPLDLELTLDCRGTYNNGWNLYVQAGLPGAPRHMTNAQSGQFIKDFRQGCIAGATAQWQGDQQGG
jgi:hypothetical protein